MACKLTREKIVLFEGSIFLVLLVVYNIVLFFSLKNKEHLNECNHLGKRYVFRRLLKGCYSPKQAVGTKRHPYREIFN